MKKQIGEGMENCLKPMFVIIALARDSFFSRKIVIKGVLRGHVYYHCSASTNAKREAR
ncbi:MAG: hypothetical protein ABIL11_18945 [Chloroflexota bacterium]